MSPTTAFLIVLIVGLLIGNFALFLLKPRKMARRHEHSEQGHALSQAQEQPVFTSHLPGEKKIELAHARIQALESRVKSMQGIYEVSLATKLEKLESFRDTASAEIIALKEIVAGMQKGNATGPKKHEAEKQPGVSDQELRRLVYRSHG